MRRAGPAMAALLLLAASRTTSGAEPARLRFAVSYPEALAKGPLDGRLLLLLSTDATAEPRFQISDTDVAKTPAGVRHRRRRAGSRARPRSSTRASSAIRSESLARRASRARYRVQALLHRYETFHRADGHIVKLPMDRGEGQQWNRAPGNLLQHAAQGRRRSRARRDGRARARQGDPADPAAGRHEVRQARSDPERAALEVLGTRRCTSAPHVLLPEGFDTHPQARYPLVINPRPLPATRSTTSARSRRTRTSSPSTRERFHLDGYNRIQQELRLPVLQGLDRAGLPARAGRRDPAREPVLRRLLRGELGEPRPLRRRDHVRAHPGAREDATAASARAGRASLYGGSTGGWEALAAQMFYPDEYNGAGSPAPTRSTSAPTRWSNIYEDKNAYCVEGPVRRTPRPAHRNYLGHVSHDARAGRTARELVLGTKSRSGEQWDIWEAVYSPGGPGRLPEADLGQAHGRDRPGGRRVLARELRPRATSCSATGQGPRQEARRASSTSTSATWTTTT